MGESKFIRKSTALTELPRDERLIGAILVSSGRLRPEEVDAILSFHRESGLRFGESGMRLGLLTQADIDHAVSRQFEFSYLRRGEGAVSEEVIAAYAPFSPQVEALRSLRIQLMMRWFETDPAHKALAIVGADRGEGRSFIASNLAVVFSQLGERTLLIDGDLRNPSQHRLFGLDNRSGFSAILSGRGGQETVQRIPGLPNLSVIPAGAKPPNPQELLARPLITQFLQQLASEADVILIDTPASAECADAQIISVRAGAALIVARKDSTRKWRVQGISDSVVQARATIVGAVLNSY